MPVRSVRRIGVTVGVLCLAALAVPAGAQDSIRVAMTYRAPGGGPSPNFSPKGTQVPITDVSADAVLPAGSNRPAKAGTIRLGPSEQAWMRVLVTADPAHPTDLCRLFLDRNRNGQFGDDGPVVTAEPSVREKTGDTWTSFNRLEIDVPYGAGVVEPYMFNVWLVRARGTAAPDVLRYSVGSWRSGSVNVGGAVALVAMMDGNNDAVFDAGDTWSVLEASAADAPKRVLSYAEARPTERLMFVADGPREFVLAFRSVSADGREIVFDRVDRPVTRNADRAGDDTVAAERSRPRATMPLPWSMSLDDGLARAKKSTSRVIVDFWATWCGPCKTMDEWVWSDAEVASVLAAGYVGVNLDGDVEKALAERFVVAGYPTMLVLDSNGKEVARLVGYQSSKAILDMLRALK
jgi:thiol-disulfide isomerase/thioredoxin